jgi:hypothetical protein
MRLVRLAKKYGVRLRRTSVRVGKLALMKHQRYAHAKRFKRARRSLRRLQTYIGRIIRDVGRKISRDGALEPMFATELMRRGRCASSNSDSGVTKSTACTRSRMNRRGQGTPAL